MKKFMKGMLIAAGVFCVAGIVLGSIGLIGGYYTGQSTEDGTYYKAVDDAWNMFRKWDFRWGNGGKRGYIVTYDGIEFDKNHGTVYGSFTDDSLQGEAVRNLDLEIGGGTLVLQQGKQMKLKKEGGPECQYYIEGDTFYLKQKSPVASREADITLTLPQGISLEEIEISMYAGEIITKDAFMAQNVDIEISAGNIVMEEVKAESFNTEMSAGSVAVHRLDAEECDIEVNMGNITLQDSLVRGEMDVDVNMGDISILMRDSYENHDYELNCSMGDITISPEDGKSREFSGIANTMELSGRNADGGSVYNLNCSMGSIFMRFAGESGSEKEGSKDKTDFAEALEGEELPEIPEVQEMPEVAEIPEIYGIEDNWPERIGRENKGTTAENFSFQIPVEEPVTLVISCVTKSGELDLEIEDENGEEIFEKDDIQTGSARVKVSRAGIYTVCFEAENHTGSFWISQEG